MGAAIHIHFFIRHPCIGPAYINVNVLTCPAAGNKFCSYHNKSTLRDYFSIFNMPILRGSTIPTQLDVKGSNQIKSSGCKQKCFLSTAREVGNLK
jgi:hypothetical protein